MDFGIQNRMSKIFQAETGKTVMLAVDHGYFQGPTTGLENLQKTIKPLAPLADCLFVTRGMLRNCVDKNLKSSVCLRVSGGPSILRELSNEDIVVSIEEAINLANISGLDLVEISPNSNPPVCKILDYGKFLYDIEKQKKINKKKQHIVHVKEIRIRPNTGDHDLITKLKRGQKFLENGDKLKVTLMYRGREFHSRKEDGEQILNKVVEILKDISVVDKPADLQGRRISVILSPK